MLLEDDSSHAAIEADIRDDLAKIGITVTARPVDKLSLIHISEPTRPY